MRFLFKISNHDSKAQKILLFNRYDAWKGKPSHLPSSLDLEIRYWDVNGEQKHFGDYSDFLHWVGNLPQLIHITESTDNRQLDFYFCHVNGMIHPASPSLTKDKQPRKKKHFHVGDEADGWDDWEYLEEWNPKKWNIADTGEAFIIDSYKAVTILKLQPEQVFELWFETKDRIKINTLLNKVKNV